MIEKIFFGEEKIIEGIRGSERYNMLRAHFDRLYVDLFAALNKEQKEKFKELCDLMLALETEASSTHFKEGFKLCMQLVLEGAGK